MSNTSNLSLTVDLSSETLFKQYVSVQDSNWKTVDSAVGSISSDVSTLQSGVSSLQESVSTVISYTDNLALRVSAMEVSISRAFSSISEFHQDLSTVVSDVTELYSLVSDVQNSVKDILSSVQATDLQVSNLQYDVSDLLSSVAYLNSSISGIVSDIEYLSSSISQLSEYVVSVVTSIVDNLSTIYGSEGSITLFSSLWSNSLYEVSISGFGEHDEIVFSAATRSDRSMWMEADPFVVASSKGEVVTFDVLSTPTSDINLFYYINRGLPAVTASTIVVTTLDASDIHDYTEIYVYYDGVETSDFQVVVSGSKVQLLFSEAVVISSVSYILTNFEWEFGVYFSEGPQQVTVNLVGSVSVNWGDGVIDNLSYHTYSSSGSYTAHLNGKINDWGPTFNNTSLITTLSFIEPTYNDNLGTFSECSNLYSVSFNSDQKSLGHQMFAYCDSLSSITLPDNLITIGAYCFAGCDALVSVEFNSTLATIEEGAFGGTALSVVSLPDTIIEVGQQAFESCNSLTTLIIPSSSESIYLYERAFRYCPNLSNIIYEGTMSQFHENVLISYYSISATFDNNVVIHCTDGDINYSWIID